MRSGTLKSPYGKGSLPCSLFSPSNIAPEALGFRRLHSRLATHGPPPRSKYSRYQKLRIFHHDVPHETLFDLNAESLLKI